MKTLMPIGVLFAIIFLTSPFIALAETMPDNTIMQNNTPIQMKMPMMPMNMPMNQKGLSNGAATNVTTNVIIQNLTFNLIMPVNISSPITILARKDGDAIFTTESNP